MPQNRRSEQAQPDISVWTIIPVSMVILLVVAILMGSILRSTQFGPVIGDIVSFDTPATALELGPVVAARVGGVSGEPQGSTCLLRPELMAAGGGSLVVERRESVAPGRFRVRWAGRRTSAGGDDCGSAAELLVAPADLLALASAAGGFGVSHKRMLMPAAALAAPTTLVE